MNVYDPAADGWRPLTGAPLPGSIGVPWGKRFAEHWRYGLLTTADHTNPAGVLHGGILMAFADHALSLLAWEACGRGKTTTIQLNTHFMDAVTPGEFIEMRGEVTRRTRGMVFLRGIVSVRGLHAERDVGAMDGIWRILRDV